MSHPPPRHPSRAHTGIDRFAGADVGFFRQVLASCGGITGRAATLVRKLVPRRFRDYIYSDIVAPNRCETFN